MHIRVSDTSGYKILSTGCGTAARSSLPRPPGPMLSPNVIFAGESVAHADSTPLLAMLDEMDLSSPISSISSISGAAPLGWQNELERMALVLLACREDLQRIRRGACVPTTRTAALAWKGVGAPGFRNIARCVWRHRVCTALFGEKCCRTPPLTLCFVFESRLFTPNPMKNDSPID